MIQFKSLKIRPKKVLSIVTLVSFIITSTFTFDVKAGNESLMYPIQEISKLKCRFNDFDTLKSDCKRQLPILKTKDYKKYIKKDWGYNEYTRIYTVLWWASYKYGWDVGQGWHMWVDIATAKGTPVYNMADGTVIVAKKDASRGNVVSVKHFIKWKEIVSNYAHLSKINVKKWQIIKVWKVIWEVWSTGNSTGNHLHFQVDLAYKYHPFYFNRNTCPYNYYKITEEGVCFEELANNTLDPLKFLETSGAILNDIVITKKPIKNKKYTKKYSNNNTNNYKWFDLNIFSKTVHSELNSSKNDIKSVQRIYKNLGYYKWSINWEYPELEKAIIAYQLDNKVINSKNENWAGWFGPKTRAHTKSSYLKYLNWNNKNSNSDKDNNKKVYITTKKSSNKSNIKTEKISRKNILTREEIQEREVKEFIKDNEINIKLAKLWGNIKIWTKFKIKLEINKKINRKKRRPFKWALPAWITFELDESVVSVFPKKMTYISKWVRNIKLKWLKPWNTTLKIKLGNKVIKSFKLKVFGEMSKIYPKTAQILWKSNIALGEIKTGIWIFKDSGWKKMINLPFNWTFILETWDNAKVCIKKGSLKNIWKVYRTKCEWINFVKNPEITYKDTVWGVLLFDYKSLNAKSLKISLVWKNSKKIYSSKKITVNMPKWLTEKYEYYNETIDMLEKWIVSGTKKWYFMEDKELNQKDALVWIENTLIEIKEKSTNPNTRAQISKKLIEIKKDKDRRFLKITRKKFLEKAYKYLVINDDDTWISIEYQDLLEIDNKKANRIFDKKNTWKDKFGERYFQPNQKITRWEWAYLLSRAMNKTQELYLTLR